MSSACGHRYQDSEAPNQELAPPSSGFCDFTLVQFFSASVTQFLRFKN